MRIERKNLMRILRTMIEFEENILIRNEMINILDDRLRSLERSKKDITDRLSDQPVLYKPERSHFDRPFDNGLFIFLIIFIGLCIFAIIAGRNASSTITNFSQLGWGFLTVILWFATFASGIIFLISFFAYLNSLKDYSKKQKENEQNYKREVSQYYRKKEHQEKEAKVVESSIQKIDEKINDINTIKKEIISDNMKSLERLNSIYDSKIIHKNYRNLLALYIIYENFDARIVNKLSGPDGAYRMVRQELPMYQILNNQERTISEIRKVQSNIGSINRQLSHLSDQVNNILGNQQTIINNQNFITQQQLRNNKKFESYLNSFNQNTEALVDSTERTKKELKKFREFVYFQETGKYPNMSMF